MIMGSHSLKTICWYSATLIRLASCNNKIRTRWSKACFKPDRQSRHSISGSFSSVPLPGCENLLWLFDFWKDLFTCYALSWTGCEEQSDSAARWPWSLQQRSSPKIDISINGSPTLMSFRFLIDDSIVFLPFSHCRKRHNLSLSQRVPSHKKAKIPDVLVDLSPGGSDQCKTVFDKDKLNYELPWVFHQVPSSTRHLHQCFHKCLTHQSNV